MNALLKKRNTLYGFCAVWIVVFHIYRRIGLPFYIPVLSEFLSLGNQAVDIFLFLSGWCLTLSAQRNRFAEIGWKPYIRRRLQRILLPYLLIAAPYYLWHALAEYQGAGWRKILQFLWNFSSASFWLRGMQTTWYVYAILMFYLLFPALFLLLAHMRSKGKYQVGIPLLLVLSCAFAYAASSLPVVKHSLIVWTRLPVFILGIAVGMSQEKIQHRLSSWTQSKKTPIALGALAAYLALAYAVTSQSRGGVSMDSVWRWLLYAPMTVCLMLFLVCILQEKKTATRGVLALCGHCSLEIYLVHITLLHPLKLYGVMEAVGWWLYLLLPIAAVAIALAVRQWENLLLKRFARSV